VRTEVTWKRGPKYVDGMKKAALTRKINTWLVYLDEKQTSFNCVVDVAISSVTNVKLNRKAEEKSLSASHTS
jgi:hypothetical protein